MTKAEFTQEILRRTGHLSRAEVDKWISFYSECVDDRMEEGMDEAEAVARLGNMEDILKSMEQETPGAALPSVYTASPDTYPAPSDAYTESPCPLPRPICQRLSGTEGPSPAKPFGRHQQRRHSPGGHHRRFGRDGNGKWQHLAGNADRRYGHGELQTRGTANGGRGCRRSAGRDRFGRSQL